MGAGSFRERVPSTTLVDKSGRKGLPSTTFVYKSGAGFTVIELILVILMFLFLGSSAFFMFNNQQLGNLESDAEIVSNRLYEAQYRAVGGIEGMPWGIHIDNATATPFYALFPGTAYTSASSTYYLSGVVEFQSPASGTSTNVVFGEITGTVTSSVSVILRLKGDTTKTKTISITPQGRISVE